MAERTNSARRGGTGTPRAWRSRLGCLTGIGVALAIVGGTAWATLDSLGYWPGSSMTTAWDSRSENKAPVDSTHQTWLAGDTLVLARYDAVTGFDADSGKERWQFIPPRRTDICAASKTTDGTRVLVAHTGKTGEASGHCAVVTALDLTDGRELWNTTLATANGGTADRSDALATGGGLGVVLDAGTGTDTTTVRAFDLLTGSERWTAAVPKGCAPARTAVAPKQVVAVLACGEEVKLAAFDPADGKERWTTPLDTRNGVATGSSVTITATDPIVLRVDEGDRGIKAFLSFGPDGRPGARVQVTGDDYGSIGPDTVVSDKRLFALTDGGPWGRLVAFDLTSGDELWQNDGIGGAAYTIQGLHTHAGRVMAVKASDRYGDHLYGFDAATGDEEEDRTFRDNAGSFDGLLPYKDRIIAVRSGNSAKPFTAYERW